MSRSVPEWVGATDDTPAPPRVRVRVFERCGGKCGQCERRINAGEKWTLEHVIAIINGGRNAESNLGVTCDWCLPVKNATDMKIKSKGYRQRKANAGIKKPSRFPCSKDSKFKKKIGTGEVVPR